MRSRGRDFEALDKTALHNALLALRICPHCRRDLVPVALAADVYGCKGDNGVHHSPETWHLPPDDAGRVHPDLVRMLAIALGALGALAYVMR